MVWFFSKKSNENSQNTLESMPDKTFELNNNQSLNSKPIEKPFRLTDPISIEQIETNIFKSCVTKCLKQNNSNLQKTDSIHIAVYHCMEFCGGKWQNAIQLEKEIRSQ